MIDQDKIYEALLFSLAKQRVPDIQKQWGDDYYTQFSSETIRVVLIHMLKTNTKFIAIDTGSNTITVRLGELLTTNEKTDKIWDILKDFGVTSYQVQLICKKGIPKLDNITEEELKTARLR